MTTIAELARPAIVKMSPYKSARSLVTRGEIFLDANESPWPVSADAVGTNRYPEPQPAALVSTLATLYGTRPEQTFVGRGADEAIDCLVRTFCEAGSEGILYCPPTYGVYATAAAIQGAFTVEVPRTEADGFAVDTAAILAAMRPGVKIIFLCSPNNPTGNSEPAETVATLCRELSGRALVVVDEAYGEFSSAASATAMLDRFPNLVVLRTLSKAYAMAGVRCGTALAHRDVIALLQKVRAPYPMSVPTVRAAMAGLSSEAQVACRERIERIVAQREWLRATLRCLVAVETVFPSDANYLLVRFRDRTAVLAACAERGIVLRDRSSEPGLEGCVRITVGAPSENEALLSVLGGFGVRCEKYLFLDADAALSNGTSCEALELRPSVVPALVRLSEAGYRMVFLGDSTAAVQAFLLRLLRSQGVSLNVENPADGTTLARFAARYAGDGGLTRRGSCVVGGAGLAESVAAALDVRFVAATTVDWSRLAGDLIETPRVGRVERRTKETSIVVEVTLDGAEEISVKTGLGYFDHLLEQIAKHGGFGLKLEAIGDLHVDEHHTIEDVALALGEAMKKALGDKRGIGRFGFTVPMDEAQARVAVDLSGRPFAVFRGDLRREKVGELPTELVPHFYRSLADSLGAAVHVEVDGENAHHMIEASFKCLGRALRPALRRSEAGAIPSTIPSTKGAL